MYSDYGTNFVGANNILKAEYEKFQWTWQKQTKELTVHGLQWHFNPPATPHAGGIWEAAVKSMKRLLVKHLTNTLLTYKEFSTVLIQVEGCLNSKLLTVLRNEPEDRIILTPNHFSKGTNLFTNPEPEAEGISLADRWKHLQNLKSAICKECKIQILHGVQRRSKWKTGINNIKENYIVIVEDSNSPMWPLGIIAKVFPGKDDLGCKLQDGEWKNVEKTNHKNWFASNSWPKYVALTTF